jgi:hypothetical protein
MFSIEKQMGVTGVTCTFSYLISLSLPIIVSKCAVSNVDLYTVFYLFHTSDFLHLFSSIFIMYTQYLSSDC